MEAERERGLDMAAGRVHPDYRPVLEALIQLEGGKWYLREKVAEAPDNDSLTANVRVLKYAYQFSVGGAEVAFLREGSRKSPDLRVRAQGVEFFLEIKRFRLATGSVARHPVAKVMNAVTAKRGQLPNSGIGLVAIDNFDLGLESYEEAGFTHDHLLDAVYEMQRSASDNPMGWQSPGGVILAAHTSGGAFSGTPRMRIPHYIWINRYSACLVPCKLANWLARTLRDGQLIWTERRGSASGNQSEYEERTLEGQIS